MKGLRAETVVKGISLKYRILNMKKRYYKILIIGVLVGSLGLFGFKAADNYFEISKNLEIYAAVIKEINTYYVDNVDPDKLNRTGMDAMLKTLDPYTNYISESEIEDYRFMTTGQYGGIGAQVIQRDDYLMITDPYENWPTQKAGLRAGDRILEIDGKSTKSKTVDDVTNLLKGQAGTVVKLLIKRDGVGQPFEKSVTREEIKVKDVPFYGMLNDHIGYIKFVGFHEDATKEMRDALVDLKKNKGFKALIIDVRNNPGGLLDEAIKTVNLFIDKGQLVVSTKGKVDEWNKEYTSQDEPVDSKVPIVVIANSHSASAAEIVSGSLQDLDRAVVLGENTYGKGLVQTTRPLPYNTQLKVTTAKYYIPSGRCIQQIDYANRDENGKPIKVADSLRKPFKTKDGRTVYDGGGVKPDIIVKNEKSPDVINSLTAKKLFFDFATQYRNKHDSIPAPKDFHLTDQDFQDFVAFTKDKEYNYSTGTEDDLKKLEKDAKDENYYAALEADLKNVKEKLDKDKNDDIFKYKQDIKDILEEEIASRYYFDRGRIISSFNHDKDVLEAEKLFDEPGRYTALLGK